MFMFFYCLDFEVARGSGAIISIPVYPLFLCGVTYLTFLHVGGNFKINPQRNQSINQSLRLIIIKTIA